LREPLTQGSAEAGFVRRAVFAVDSDSPPGIYAKCADMAFSGYPGFSRRIVVEPGQWGLRERSRKRVVIKEVNPLAVEWLISRWSPRTVLLVRHPAGVASSYLRLGWGRLDTADGWYEHGRFQGNALSRALDSLCGYPEYRVVHYESICADPRAAFMDLFEFARLTWNDRVSAFVAFSATGPADEQRDTHGLVRDSRRMSRDWTRRLMPWQIEELRRGYAECGVPLYGGDDDW
jgi:hypothetical protein